MPYWALGLSHILQFARAFVTVAYFVLQAASFISLRLPGRYRFAHTSLGKPHSIHFSSFQFTGYQLFSSPAGSLGLRQTLCKPLAETINCFACIKVCLVLSIVWHAFLPSPFGGNEGGFCHTCNIVCTRPHRTSSCSRAAHPRSTRRWLAAQRIANHSFIRFS